MPNRIIKETVCSSDTIDQMTWFEECFYHRLWTACDDYGRMDARLAILKAKLFPLKERLSLKDIQSALQKMVDIGCVRLYECDSKPYLYLPSWEVHQQVRAKKSKYPSPDESCNQMISHDIKCPRNPIQSESESESEDELRVREVRFPAPATPTDPKIAVVFTAYAEKIGPKSPLTERIRDQLLAFLDAMGADCCIRAMDEAVEQGHINWKYVKAILEKKRKQGVRSIADWEKAEQEWEGGKGSTKSKSPTDFQPDAARIQKNNDWLDEFLKEQEGGG